MHDEHTVLIQHDHWQRRGGRMMRWIHDNLGIDCYRLRFNRYDPVKIIFDDPTQAFIFRMTIAFSGNEMLW